MQIASLVRSVVVYSKETNVHLELGVFELQSTILFLVQTQSFFSHGVDLHTCMTFIFDFRGK